MEITIPGIIFITIATIYLIWLFQKSIIEHGIKDAIKNIEIKISINQINGTENITVQFQERQKETTEIVKMNIDQ